MLNKGAEEALMHDGRDTIHSVIHVSA